jgi:hypothetical protein
MRAHDFTAEMAGEIHGGVRKALMDKGYKYLGSGIDKQAYLEPGTGQVLIVFGYRKGHKDFSPDQRMFIDWINYCNTNKNNPHLPRFSGFESFQFQGKNYIQARMEPLKELSDQMRHLVTFMDGMLYWTSAQGIDKALEILAKRGYYNPDDNKFNTYTVKQVVKYLGGQANVESLLNTVREVRDFGEDHGYHIDLHGGNYMQRADRTIVVNDPFVLWLNS